VFRTALLSLSRKTLNVLYALYAIAPKKFTTGIERKFLKKSTFSYLFVIEKSTLLHAYNNKQEELNTCYTNPFENCSEI